MPKVLISRDDPKYLQVAVGIEQMIQEEILRIGDKLPLKLAEANPESL